MMFFHSIIINYIYNIKLLLKTFIYEKTNFFICSF